MTLVGHSYGGVVITEADSHTKVAPLVYIAGPRQRSCVMVCTSVS
ncbi:alpha/beta hydrolase [Streptomyces lavendulae]